MSFYTANGTIICYSYMSAWSSPHVFWRSTDVWLLSSGLYKDLQVEWCQFLVHKTVGGEVSSVRYLLCVFMTLNLEYCSRPATKPILPLFCSLRTLFKFIKKFEEALNGPSLPALVEQGSSSNLDTLDVSSEEIPIHLVHHTIKSILPGKCRDFQVCCSAAKTVCYLESNLLLVFKIILTL